MTAQRPWRLLPFGDYSAAENMAIDEALLESVLSGESGPVLRLYRFVPPAVSIGLSQRLGAEIIAEIQEQGFDVVRRPTGGRAVLHKDDLTYAFIGPDVSLKGGFLSTGVTESYKQICQGLICAFAELGVDSEVGATGVSYRHLQDCFMATTNSDLHHKGTKLIGSAQVRRKGGVLQHGSMPLKQDQGLMAKLLHEEGGEQQRHVNFYDIVGDEIEDNRFREAFRKGFETAFSCAFEDDQLTAEELALVERIRGKYRPDALERVHQAP